MFREGEKVEVCSKQEGFIGSYYEATVIKHLDDTNSYLVQYKNLVEEYDQSRPLKEVVSADEVRPLPPPQELPISGGFSMCEVVDAFDNDGWWVGVIDGKAAESSSKYYVYFHTTGDRIAYDASLLRYHRNWSNGKWT